MSNNSSLCAIAEDLSLHLAVLLACVFVILISLLAFYCSLVLIKCLLTKPVFHPNLRATVRNLTVALALFSLGNVVSGIYQLIVSVNGFATNQGPCYYVVRKGDCALQLVLEWVTGTVIIQSIFILAAERIWATVQYRTYENANTSSFGVLSTLALWLFGGLFGVQLVAGNNDPRATLPFCSSYLLLNWPPRSHPSTQTIYVVVVVDALQYALFWTLQRRNRRLKRQTESTVNSLTVRFQASDNVKMGAMINRIVLVQFYVSVAFNGVIHGLPALQLQTPLLPLLAYHLCLVNFALFALQLVRICVDGSSTVRTEVQLRTPSWLHKCLLKQRKVAQVLPLEQQSALQGQMGHFVQLEQMWKDGYRKKTVTMTFK